jgi:hypothetical protein
MSNWEEIKQEVETNGNLRTFTMETLREAHGSGKLGVHVRREISKSLAGMGLGHIPQELPNSQREQVRLYKRGTAVGELIETVLTPGESNDRKLVEKLAETDNDYVSIVEQIRDLVSE